MEKNRYISGGQKPGIFDSPLHCGYCRCGLFEFSCLEAHALLAVSKRDRPPFCD